MFFNLSNHTISYVVKCFCILWRTLVSAFYEQTSGGANNRSQHHETAPGKSLNGYFALSRNRPQGHQKRGSVIRVLPSFLLNVDLLTNLPMGPIAVIRCELFLSHSPPHRECDLNYSRLFKRLLYALCFPAKYTKLRLGRVTGRAVTGNLQFTSM